MRALNPREKRTVRFGAAAIAVYLLLFGGLQSWKFFNHRSEDYQRLQAQAKTLKQELKVYDDKIEGIRKLMETFHLDPAKLTRAKVVAETSAAIQKAALGGGVQVGAVRESPARPSNKELGSIQMEAMGPVPALLGLLQRMQSVGYPLIIDAVSIGSDSARPGPVKLNLTIVILDFDQWKEAPNA